MRLTRRAFMGSAIAACVAPYRSASAAPPAARLTLLSEGVRTVLQSDDLSDTMALSLFVRQERSETALDEAIRRLVNTALFGGSTHMSMDTILDSVRKLGSVVPRTLPNGLCVTVTTTPDQARGAAYLLCEAIKNATFEKDAIERARVGLIQSAEDRKSDPFLAGYDALVSAVSGSTEPTAIDLRHVNTEQAIAYHRRHFVPSRTVFSAAGHYDEGLLQRSLDNNLFEYDRDALIPPPIKPSDARKNPAEIAAPESHATGVAWAMVASPAPAVTEPEFVPALLASTILGGGHASILFQNLREKEGIGYSVGTAFRWEESAPIVGYVGWDTGADTLRRPASASEVTKKIVAEMDRLANDPAAITRADLDRAIGFSSGQYLLRSERISDRSFLAGWFEMMGAGFAMDANLVSMIRAASLERVRQYAASHFSIHTALAASSGKSAP
jgi:zinc protease